MYYILRFSLVCAIKSEFSAVSVVGGLTVYIYVYSIYIYVYSIRIYIYVYIDLINKGSLPILWLS